MSINLAYAQELTKKVTGANQVSEEDIADAMGEVLNCIAGLAKAYYNPDTESFKISIPTIVSGSDYITFLDDPKKNAVTIIRFTCGHDCTFELELFTEEEYQNEKHLENPGKNKSRPKKRLTDEDIDALLEENKRRKSDSDILPVSRREFSAEEPVVMLPENMSRDTCQSFVNNCLAMAGSSHNEIAVDFALLKQVNAFCLVALMAFIRLCEKNKKRLIFINVPEAVKNLFITLQIDKNIPVL